MEATDERWTRRHYARMVLDLIGRPIRPPPPGQPQVAGVHIDWHQAEVVRDLRRKAA
ncbi:MAG: hypothetical protein ACI8Y4_005453 [Candidatus Poriferisodalaceae bacterium]|jgi:hypothetical protein